MAAKAIRKPTPETQPFWDGCAAGERRLQQRDDFQRYYFFPPRPSCHPPVYHLVGGESAETPLISQIDGFASPRAFRVSGRQASQKAGITHDDVPIHASEDLGFVPRGEAGAFVEDGNTRMGGALPMNTNGGGLSYTHTGRYGMFAVQESVRQLRGTTAAQVPDVKIGAVRGVGGMFASASTLVLTNQQP